MKKLLFIALFLAPFIGNAQDIAKDTLQLNEVRVSEVRKPKLKQQKVNGCTHLGTLDHPQEIITLIDDLPNGLLHSVTFSFNNSFRNKHVTFRDTDIEVVFYKKNPDGTPGELISSKQLTVSKDHKGTMEIDVAGLNIEKDGDLFVGLKRLSLPVSPVPDFEVHCVCSRSDKYISYGRFYVKGDAKTWMRINVPAAIKMTVTTEVH